MKEIFKNKFFIVGLFFIITIFFCNSCVNASDDNETITFYSEDFEQDLTVTLPSGLGTNYNNYIILTRLYNDNSDTRYRIYYIFSNSDFIYYPYNNSFCVGTTNNSPYIVFYRSDYFISNNITNLSNCNVDFNNSSANNEFGFDGYLRTGVNHPLSANLSISNTNVYDNNNELVFQAPPQVVEEGIQVTIPAIQQVEEIPQGMTQVLQVIIPIGLIVLSIGLVIYLMRLVIYRMQS